MKKLSLLFLFAFVIVLSSCQEECVISQENPLDDIRSVVYTTNPFESYGIEHNQILSSAFNALLPYFDNSTFDRSNAFYSTNPTFDQTVVDIATTSCQTLYPSTTATEIDDFLTNNGIKDAHDNRTLQTLYDNASSTLASITTNRDAEKTMEILNLLKEISVNAANDTSSTVYVYDLYQSIIDKEAEILSIDWFSNETEALKAIAIAKYSYNFWLTKACEIEGNTVNLILEEKSTPGLLGTSNGVGSRVAAANAGAVAVVDVVAGVAAGVATAGAAAIPAAAAASFTGAVPVVAAVSTGIAFIGDALGWWN